MKEVQIELKKTEIPDSVMKYEIGVSCDYWKIKKNRYNFYRNAQDGKSKSIVASIPCDVVLYVCDLSSLE